MRSGLTFHGETTTGNLPRRQKTMALVMPVGIEMDQVEFSSDGLVRRHLD
jgi:hypothetical protein